MWAIDVYLEELVSRAQECLVPSAAGLCHDVIEHCIAHPSWRRNDNRTKRRIRIRYVPEERGVEGRVELSEALFVRRGACRDLAGDGNFEALEDDRHVFRQETEYRSPCTGTVNRCAVR